MKATIVVDLQNDFLETGALPVPGAGRAYCDKIALRLESELAKARHIFFSREQHPKDHTSFTEFGGEWPAHCIEDTKGGDIVSSLVPLTAITTVHTVTKGTNKDNHPYSAFGNDKENTGLHDLLDMRGITELDIFGLATDYCVKDTVLDALKLGYKVNLLLDYCRGITPGTVASAVDEMAAAGATIVREE